jgi:DNA-binding transcriptional LysR family regulator
MTGGAGASRGAALQTDFLRDATTRGLGITLLPEFIAEQELQQGTLQIVNKRAHSNSMANLEATCFPAPTLRNQR